MVNKLTCMVVILFLASVLTSCSNKSAPECSDTITIEKVEELVRSETDNNSLPLELTFIRTDKSDVETDRQECAALAIFEGSFGSSIEIPITYSSELTDKKDFYYQLTSFNKGNVNFTNSEESKLKSEIIMNVFPNIVCIQKAASLYFTFAEKIPSDDDTKLHEKIIQDCNLTYFVPSISNGIVTIWINEKNTEKILNKLHGKGLTFTPVINSKRIVKWKISGAIAEQFGWNQ